MQNKTMNEWMFLLTIEDIKIYRAILYIVVNICNLVLSKRCLISWCKKVAMGTSCTFQQLYAKCHPHTQSPILVLNMSQTLMQCLIELVVLNKVQMIPQKIMRDLSMPKTTKKSSLFRDLLKIEMYFKEQACCKRQLLFVFFL